MAGEADSGKTTLLASLYEKFNEGSIRRVSFRWLETLTGWERRCHSHGSPPGILKPDTGRTIGVTRFSLLASPGSKGSSKPQDHALSVTFPASFFGWCEIPQRNASVCASSNARTASSCLLMARSFQILPTGIAHFIVPGPSSELLRRSNARRDFPNGRRLFEI